MKIHALIGSLGVTALLLIQGNADAGLKYFQSVSVDATNKVAQGVVSDVRNDSNVWDYIGCTITGYNPEYSDIHCYAWNRDLGQAAACETYANDHLVKAYKAVKSDSLLLFQWDSSGNCVYIAVYNASSHAPKVP